MAHLDPYPPADPAELASDPAAPHAAPGPAHAPPTPVMPEAAALWPDARPVPLAKRWGWLLALVAAAVLLDMGVGAALDGLSQVSKYRYSMLYAGKIDADIIILGNSRGESSLFAPEVSERLGVKAFNLSQNGMGMDGLEIIAGDYLRLNRPPKLLLVEVTATIVKTGESFFAFQPYFARSPSVQRQLRAVSPARYWASRFINVYRYNGGVAEKIALYLRKDDQHYISPATRTVAPDLLFSRSIGREPILAEQAEAWRRLLADARARGVTVVPFIAPYLQGSLDDRDLRAEYTAALNAGVDAPPAIEDFSRSISPDSAFSDRVHTNAAGATLLLQAMVERGVFRP